MTVRTGTVDAMADELSPHDIVQQSALQLWAAAQTDFDPFQVPPEEWGPTVPIKDADIAIDTHLDLATVREALTALDGHRLVVGRDAGNMSVESIIPDQPS
ncbi:MAG: hypothetical protein JWN68_2306 [Nocardioides sp.]|nr:hypothetical protein [Nocardioides sp.]